MKIDVIWLLGLIPACFALVSQETQGNIERTLPRRFKDSSAVRICLNLGGKYGRQTMVVPKNRLPFFTSNRRTNPVERGYCRYSKSDKPKTLTRRDTKNLKFCRMIMQKGAVKKWISVKAPRAATMWMKKNGFSMGKCVQKRGVVSFRMKHVPRKTATVKPTRKPTRKPTKKPTRKPIKKPSKKPKRIRTRKPTTLLSQRPTNAPSIRPTHSPSTRPTDSPSKIATNSPSKIPTHSPSRIPTHSPSTTPTNRVSNIPATSQLTTQPPTAQPTQLPTTQPTTRPPTAQPTTRPPTKKPITTRLVTENRTAVTESTRSSGETTEANTKTTAEIFINNRKRTHNIP